MVLCVGLCMQICDVVLCVGLCMQICDVVLCVGLCRYVTWLKVFGAWKDFIILRTVKKAKVDRAMEQCE